MTNYKNTLEFAKELDQQDPLANFRNQFHIPKNPDGTDQIYLCGNSLGLQPKKNQRIPSRRIRRLG